MKSLTLRAGRRVMTLVLLATALLAVAVVAPTHASAEKLLAGGNVCGFSDTSHVDFVFLSGTAGTVVHVTVTVNGSDDDGFFYFKIGAPPFPKVVADNFLGVETRTYTAILPATTSYVVGYSAGVGTTTITISCGQYGSAISGDGRLNDGPDQAAQSVAIYCNSDGSLNLLPLQLNNPPPGAAQAKDSKGNKINYTTAPLKTITKAATYGDITIDANGDGSWTVYRQELNTAKTYYFRVTTSICPQTQ